MLAAVEREYEVKVVGLRHLLSLAGLVAILVSLVLPVVMGGPCGMIDAACHRPGLYLARLSLLNVISRGCAVGEPVARVLVLVLDAVEHIVHGLYFPL